MPRHKVRFEGVDTGGGGGTELPSGYQGFIWNNFGAIESAEAQPSGFIPVSGSANGFLYPTTEASIMRAGGGDFAFKSGIFAGAYQDGITIFAIGVQDGVTVATKTFTVDYGVNQKIRFGRDFRDVDFVLFRPQGGTDADPGDAGSGRWISVDDFVFRTPPEPMLIG